MKIPHMPSRRFSELMVSADGRRAPLVIL